MRETSQPQPFPDGSHVAHIGLPKTGTSSLQASFDAGRDRLAEQGVYNATKGRHQLTASKAGVGTLEPWRDQHKPHANWDALTERFRTSDARITLLSSEELSAAKAERIPQVVEQLGGDLQVVVTLRALAPLLSSAWQQELHRRQTLSLDEWLQQRLVGDDEQVMRKQSLPRILREWGSVVGEDAITFVIADPTVRTSTMTVFEGLLGLQPGTLREEEWDNASFPYPEAELLRHFNLAYTERGGDHPTWMRTVNWKARFRFGAMQGLERHPIQLPRWAAERANQLSTTWVEAIKDTDVQVVGDLEQLFVDPSSYDEVPVVPDKVDVASAGRVADILFEVALEHEHQQPDQPAPDLGSFSSRQLLGELRRRVTRRGRR